MKRFPRLRLAGSDGELLAFLSGVNIIGVAITGRYRSFVKPSMGIWLLMSGILLTAISTLKLLRSQPEPDGHGDHEGHEGHEGLSHSHGHAHGIPAVAALLVLPVAALFVMGPRTLGSFAASRAATAPPPIDQTEFVPLAAGPDGAAEVTLIDVWYRANYDEKNSLSRQPLRMIGFVAPDPDAENPNAFLLTRFRIGCCAADALPVQIRILDPSARIAADQWVEVSGSYAGQVKQLPAIRNATARFISVPDDPFL
jgi:uncharacterized repeat protein (TIGR03943 family)